MKFTKIITFLLVCALGIGTFAACTSGGETASAEEATYVSLRINPEIELIADEDGKVITANAVNEDGEVVLSTVDLEGKTIEDAGKIFTETANELGYLDTDGEKDTVHVGVESTIDGEAEAVKEKLHKSIRDYFNNNGINGKVSPETLDKYADKAAEWGLSNGHVKLVMRVLDTHPELTDTEVIDLSVKELMKLLKGEKNEEKIAVSLKEEYREEVNALKEEHAELFELKEEVKELKLQLEEQLNDQEKADIEEQIKNLKDQIKTLEKEFKEELKDLNKSYQKESARLRKEYRKQAKEKKKDK